MLAIAVPISQEMGINSSIAIAAALGGGGGVDQPGRCLLCANPRRKRGDGIPLAEVPLYAARQ